MNTSTKLSALALAAAAFATTTLLAGTASAHGFGGRSFGHGPVVTGTGLHMPTGAPRPLPYRPTGANPSSHGGGEVVSCHPGTGCTVTPTHGDHDHDGYHRGYDRDRWFGWRGRPEIIVEDGPAMVAPGTVSAPVPAMLRGPAPAPQVAEGPCTCLTKQYQPDGSVVFQDICTKEGAIAPPQAMGAR